MTERVVLSLDQVMVKKPKLNLVSGGNVVPVACGSAHH